MEVLKRPSLWISAFAGFSVSCALSGITLVFVIADAANPTAGYSTWVLASFFVYAASAAMLGGVAAGVLLSARSKQHKGREADQDKAA